MTISAKMIADSISPNNIRISTLQLRYPKFIHGELMTHRVFSRNASSSRAIPVKRLIEDIKLDTAMPVFWGSNKPGMQAGEQLNEKDRDWVRNEWKALRDDAIESAEQMIEKGLHKQIANRVLEPWCHINVVVTSTEWTNFYGLRRHPDTQPEMKALADTMWVAMQESKPTLREPGNWHLPYVNNEPTYFEDGILNALSLEPYIKCSVARCARVSYMTHEMKVPTIENDLKLYDMLMGSHPVHASPAEHQATPSNDEELYGNFKGWTQFRKTVPNENITEYDGDIA